MNRSREKINESVIEGVKNGDMASFDIIYRAYSKKLFGFVLQIIKIEPDAEEIVQEVFLKLWESRSKIDNFSLFDSYLFTIAYNKAISLTRKRLSEKKYIDHVASLQDVHPGYEQLDDSEYEKLSQQVKKIVEKLPSRQKEVFKLHRENGMTYNEIAGKLDISKNTVENHMAKALKFIRNNLDRQHLACLFFIYMFL